MINDKRDENYIEIIDDLSRKASAVLVFHLFILSCKNMLVSTIPAINNMNSVINSITTVLLVVLYLKVFLLDGGYRRITKKGFLFIVFIILFLLISFSFDQKLFMSSQFPYNYVQSEFIKFLTYSFPMFLIMLIIRDYCFLTEYLFKYSYILFVFATIGVVGSIVIENSNIVTYSMSFGNAVLLYTMISILKFHREYNGKVFLSGCLSIIYILINGSRGPLVSIAVMIVYLFVFRAKRSKEKIIAISIIMLVLLFIVFYKEVLQVVVALFQYFGLSSRTLIYAVNSSILYDSGRQEYYDVIYEALAKSPVLGLGAFGGEALVGLTHSLYVDIFANFGYIFGTIFILWIVGGSIRCAYKYRNTNVEEFVMFLFIACFPRGFFSDSFWTARELWMLMGILMGQISFYNYIRKG